MFEKYVTTISLGGKEIKLNLYDTAGKRNTIHYIFYSWCNTFHIILKGQEGSKKALSGHRPSPQVDNKGVHTGPESAVPSGNVDGNTFQSVYFRK